MTKKFFQLLLVALLAVPFVGCGKTAEPATTPEETPATETGMMMPTESMLVALKSADMLDGNEDKRIEKCYVCALGMNGSEEFEAKIGEYTACFCSEGCCEHFKEAPEEVVTTTEIPEAEAAAEAEVAAP